MECIICDKHKSFAEFAGKPIAESKGLVVSHYPVIDNDLAIRGHLLIEPAKHLTDVMELDDSSAQALGLLIRDCVRLLITGLGAEHAYVFRLNDKVAHFHMHVVPRFLNTPKEYWGHKITEWPGATKLNLKEVGALSETLQRHWKQIS